MIEKRYYVMGDTFTYADVLIEPAYSDINSRDEIDITSNFLGAKRIPIISSPMDTVSGPDMVIAMANADAYGVLHRFQNTTEERTLDVAQAYRKTFDFGISVGVKEQDETIKWLDNWDIVPHSILIDVAHGHHQLVADMIKRIRDWNEEPLIIAGNVATFQGFTFLAEAGADAIRVGIGGGSACTTRENTGIGVPQLSAILDCAVAQDNFDGVSLIADGGIQTPGDIVKALAAGADAVMLGRMLAGADETPGDRNGNIKYYRGQSTIGTNGERKAPEGVTGQVNSSGPVKDTIEVLSQYIKSGMSYVGARNLEDLRKKARFTKVSAGTAKESGVRI